MQFFHQKVKTNSNNLCWFYFLIGCTSTRNNFLKNLKVTSGALFATKYCRTTIIYASFPILSFQKATQLNKAFSQLLGVATWIYFCSSSWSIKGHVSVKPWADMAFFLSQTKLISVSASLWINITINVANIVLQFVLTRSLTHEKN